jgi:hypothetical protein
MYVAALMYHAVKDSTLTIVLAGLCYALRFNSGRNAPPSNLMRGLIYWYGSTDTINDLLLGTGFSSRCVCSRFTRRWTPYNVYKASRHLCGPQVQFHFTDHACVVYCYGQILHRPLPAPNGIPNKVPSRYHLDCW